MYSLNRATLTTRGWAVVGLVIGGSILGLLFGSRSLNAIVAPSAVAVLVAMWRVGTVSRPSIDRRSPAETTVGERRTVSLTFDEPPRRLGHIADRVSPPLEADGNDRAVALDEGLVYGVTLDTRGYHRFGPTTVTIEDVLGLARRSLHYSDQAEVLVLPRTYALRIDGLRRIAHLADIKLQRERHEFDRLREYRPGDSLRDVHWKTSAKRPDIDFIVKEFVKEDERGAVALSGEAVDGADDALADAMASVAVALVNAGVQIELHTPGDALDPVDRPDEVHAILEHLATVEAGDAATRGDLHFSATDDDVTTVSITLGDDRLRFGDLILDPDAIGKAPTPTEPTDAVSEVAD